MTPLPGVTVAPLREWPQHLGFFAAAFESEWPAWYGPGGQGNAKADLVAFADPRGELPVGVIVLGPDGQPLGVAALKPHSIPSHRHLSPWAAAGYVVPGWRRRGLGARLLHALLLEAARLGCPKVYCATATAAPLLRREGWVAMETVAHDGQAVTVFSRTVPRPASTSPGLV